MILLHRRQGHSLLGESEWFSLRGHSPEIGQLLIIRSFVYLMQRAGSLEKTLMLKKEEEKGTTEDEII